MGEKHACSVDAPTVFKYLIEAINAGSEITPLIGAGMSVDAGIPTAPPLVEYLVDFNLWLADLPGKPKPYRYLQDNPWPGRHDLVVELITSTSARQPWPGTDAGIKAAFDALQQRRLTEERRLIREAAKYELGPRHATVAAVLDALANHPTRTLNRTQFAKTTGYRALLEMMCESDQALIDTFFDRLMLSREPTMAQQYVAFLTQHFGGRMVLSTNFDSLLEKAMVSEGLHPRVYEIVKGTPLPSVRVVRRQEVAVLKLHGGAYSLRTGADLDERLDAATLREFERYLTPPGDRPPPVLLVMGYSGSDQRVMDIVAQHIRADYRTASAVRVVWISRYDANPPDNLKTIIGNDCQLMPRVKVVEYRDCGRFLQELYQRQTCQHAVTRRSYRPTRSHDRRIKAVERDPANFEKKLKETFVAIENNNLTVIYASKGGSGTSTLLFQAANKREKDKNVVWINIDLADYRSRATVFSYLASELSRYDRGISKVTRPLFINDVDYLGLRSKRRLSSETKAETWDCRIATRLLRNALRRGNYLITFDSLGEFASGHPAMPVKPVYRTNQTERLIQFIKDMAGKRGTIGRSRVAVAVTQSGSFKNKDDLVKKLITSKSFNAKVHATSPAALHYRDATKKWLHEKGLQDPAQLLVLVAACFMRKSRSRASLITMVMRIAECRVPFKGERLVKAVSEFNTKVRLTASPLRGTDAIGREIAEKAIDVLADSKNRVTNSACTVLESLEGGFYWMHLEVRDALFELLVEPERRQAKWPFIHRDEIALVYDRIADFAYTDAFERSQSTASFVEYFFFRAMSIKFEQNAEIRMRRWHWVVSTLRNESNQLLGRPALVPLANHVRNLIELLVEQYGEHRHGRIDLIECLRRLVGVYADLIMNCGHSHRALPYRLWQGKLLRGVFASGAKYASLGENEVLKQTNSAIADLVKFAATIQGEKRQLAIQLLIDIGATVTDSILNKNAPAGRPDWTNPTNRKKRLNLGRQAFSHANTLAKIDSTHDTERDYEIRTRAVIRKLEYDLRCLNEFRFQKKPKPCTSKVLLNGLNLCQSALEDVRRGGKASRRRRHRSYLYLAKARLQALQHLWLASDVAFNRARASLSRTGGSAERSALGVVSLFHAEMLLRRARSCSNDANHPNERPRFLKAAARFLRNADDLLVNDSRTENRWRVFFRYLAAICYRHRAELIPMEGASTQQLYERRDLLDRGMREIINALTNTGLRSDRRVYLEAEYNKLLACLAQHEPAPPYGPKVPIGVKPDDWLRIRYGLHPRLPKSQRS